MRFTNNSKTWMLCTSLAAGLLCFAVLPLRAQDTGEALFKSKCAMCHGPDGAGKTKMGEMLKIPDLHSEQVQRQTEAQLVQVIAKGKNKMPAYEGKLTKEEIAELAAYVHELGKKH